MSEKDKAVLLEKNILVLLKQVVSLLILKYWAQTGFFIALCITMVVFYANTRATNADYPIFKEQVLNKLNQISTAIKVLDQKVNDYTDNNHKSQIESNKATIKMNDQALEAARGN